MNAICCLILMLISAVAVIVLIATWPKTSLQPELQVRKLEIGRLTFSSIQINITMDITLTNPNRFKLVLSDGSADVQYNMGGHYTRLGLITNLPTVKLSSNEPTTFQGILPLHIDTAMHDVGLVTEMASHCLIRYTGWDLKVEFRFAAGAPYFPLSIPISFKDPKVHADCPMTRTLRGLKNAFFGGRKPPSTTSSASSATETTSTPNSNQNDSIFSRFTPWNR